MDNGILQVSISTPQGFVIEIQYKGNKNLLNVQNEEDNRGYQFLKNNLFYGLTNSNDSVILRTLFLFGSKY